MDDRQNLFDGGLNTEIAGLVDLLHKTESRLEVLTGGQVDSVADANGRMYLLQRAQESLRYVEACKQAAILDALPAHIALLDARGYIISVNEAWSKFSEENQLEAYRSIGTDYVAACVTASNARLAAGTQEVAEGVRSVLSGAKEKFSIEFVRLVATEKRWFLMTVTPLSLEGADGAVVMHLDITAERRSEERLRVSELRFRQMADNITDVFFLQNLDGTQIYYVSPSYERIWGRSCASLYENSFSWLASIHPDDRFEVERQFKISVTTGIDCIYRMLRADGEQRWVHIRTFPVLAEDGQPYRTAGVATDITVRKEAEDRVKYLNRVYAMLGGINMLIMRAGARDYLFTEACRVAGKEGEFPMSWIGMIDPTVNRIRPVASQGLDDGFLGFLGDRLLGTDAQLADTLTTRAIREKKPMVAHDSERNPASLFGALHAKEGICSMAVLPLIVSNEAVGVLALYAREVEFFHDDEMKLLTQLADDIAFGIDHIGKQERLDFNAYYDLLTGLANRRLFLDRVAQYARSAVIGEHQLAVCFIDVEHFKNFNDTYGQQAGDALLKQVAKWLTAELGDENLLARIGADKFAAIIPKVAHGEEVARILEKTLTAFLEHPFQLDGNVIRIAAKVGVAVFPEDGDSAEALFRNAEVALKKAKAAGDRYLFFAQKMTETVAGRLSLEFRLRLALDKEEFSLHYQPKVDLATRAVTGVEALLRWHDLRLGMVPPNRFIPILEDTGLIFDVGRWALRKAVEDYLRWCDAGLTPVCIAVNVSPLQLRNRDFIREVKQAISGDPRSAAGLELEITESVIMHDVETTITSLQQIRAMGVSIAIDDFGTGFSSLSYLAKLPVDTLKIDRSFVADMTASPEGLSLVSTIIDLAHSLKLSVVAEGVETEEQARLLRLLDCDEMQGFLISRAEPAATFESRFLARA